VPGLTVLVKTILRPQKCRAMLESLRDRFTGPIVVCDDSPVHYPEVGDGLHVTWQRYSTDIGIGACLNTALEFAVDTPYAALLDDDFIITERTDMTRWIPFLEYDVYDVIGGAVRRMDGSLQGYVGMLDYNGGDSLVLNRVPDIGAVANVSTVDLIMNFFAARTETLREIGWDEALKVFRHEDWFLRAKCLRKRVGYHPHVEVLHNNVKPGEDDPEEYRALRRHRLPKYRAMFCDKWGLDERKLRL